MRAASRSRSAPARTASPRHSSDAGASAIHMKQRKHRHRLVIALLALLAGMVSLPRLSRAAEKNELDDWARHVLLGEPRENVPRPSVELRRQDYGRATIDKSVI